MATEDATRVRKPEETGIQQAKHDLPDKDTCELVLSKMMLIRRFEERAGEMYAKAKIGGFLHLCIGEEATVVGGTQALRETDYLMSTYREHGQALARGTHPNAVMAELFGRVDGCSGGRGGSMHLFDAERRFLGGYGIVGGSLPLSGGVALAADYLGTDDVILSMMGDGATNQGTFGETMNLVALWKLPVVFLIINNQFGMGTALERHSAVTDLSKKAEGFGVPGPAATAWTCSTSTRSSATRCTRRARTASRSSSRPSPTATAATRWPTPRSTARRRRSRSGASRDPIAAFSERLIEERVLSQEDVEELDAQAIARVDEAVEFADRSPFPDLDSLYDDVYVYTRRRPRLVDRRRALARGAPRRARARGRRAPARAGRAGRRVRERRRRRGAPSPQPRRPGRRGRPAGPRRGRGRATTRRRRRQDAAEATATTRATTARASPPATTATKPAAARTDGRSCATARRSTRRCARRWRPTTACC